MAALLLWWKMERTLWFDSIISKYTPVQWLAKLKWDGKQRLRFCSQLCEIDENIYIFYIIFSSAFGNLTILESSDSSGNCWEIDNLANAKYFNLKTHLTCRKKERKLKDACGRAETFLKRGGKSVLSKVVKCHLICQQHKIKVNKIQCWKSCQHSQNKSMANKMKIKHAFDCLSYQKIM